MYKYNIVQLGMHIFVYSLAQLKLIKSWVHRTSKGYIFTSCKLKGGLFIMH